MAEFTFIDTNVWLDWMDLTRPRHDEAEEFFSVIFKHPRVKLATSESIITSLAYFLSKKHGYRKTCDYLDLVLSYTTLIAGSNRSFQDALANYPKDIEDRLLEAIALENSVQFIITNDKTGFGYTQQVEVMEPLDYLTRFVKR